MKFRGAETARRLGGALTVVLLGCGRPSGQGLATDSSAQALAAVPTQAQAAVPTTSPSPGIDDGVALGSSLGEWRAGGSGDSLIILDAALQMQEDATADIPLVQPLCAQATRVIKTEEQVVYRRRVLFDLVPPPGVLPDRGATREAIRDRYCRVVLVGVDGSDSHEEGRDEDIEIPFLDSLLKVTEAAVISDPVPPPAGGKLPPGILGRTRDGAIVGWLVNHIYHSMDFSCFDGVTYEIAGRGSICYALYRWREGAPTGRSQTLAPVAQHPSDPILGFLLPKLRAADPALAQQIEDRTLLLHADSPHLDTAYVQLLQRLKSLASSAQGTRAVTLFALLDAAIEQGMQARVLGTTGDAEGGDVDGTTLKALNAAPAWEEMGGSWGYERAYLRRAEQVGARGEFRDSLYAWLRRGESACTYDYGQDFAERIQGQRRYLDPDAPALSLEANSAMAQLWADSLRDTHGAEAAAVVDSARAALVRAYALARDPAFKERLRVSIWFAAGGLSPLPQRESCHVND